MPKKSITICWILGILVEPPTRTASCILLGVSFASRSAASQGRIVLWNISKERFSIWALVILVTRCFGPLASAVMNGRLISASSVCESSTFALSAASLSLWSAIGSLETSMPLSLLKFSTMKSISTLSMSSPPRWVSPLVALTSITPSLTSSIEMSKVPPPKS